VSFGPIDGPMEWKAGVTDIYGMPQATVYHLSSSKRLIMTNKNPLVQRHTKQG
jgi:hypothetical protein